MNIDYNKAFNSFIEYTNKCREMIRKSFFSQRDTFGMNINSGNKDIDAIVKKHRQKMIDIKLEHTIRMIEQIIKINMQLGIDIDLQQVIKVSVLYHDIGRMRQSTWSNTFSDSIYKTFDMPYMNHGEDGYDIFMNSDFNIPKEYKPIIGTAIKYHLDFHSIKKLGYKYEDDLAKIKLDNIITGKLDLNDAEWQVASLITQLVADIDKADILYQNLTDDFDMIRDYVFDRSMKSLKEISTYWGVPIEEIAEYNGISISNYKPQKIMIPIKNMDLNRLAVPGYMKEMFYNNSYPKLGILVQDQNWNFVSILWWRLSHFLNQITFTTVLINIEEYALLEQIYEKIPMELRFLFDEAFSYARDELIYSKLQKNKNRIYLR